MTSRASDNAAHTIAPPDSFAIGDDLKWNAPWVTVRLWVELPFWLMVNDTKVAVEHQGHTFPVTIHDKYFDLFVSEATDSRTTVVYRGPVKKREDLSPAVKQAIDAHPGISCMWRKCKTYLKVESRCNEDVWNAAGEQGRRRGVAKLYMTELCRAHIPVINKLIRAYRLATYDYFAFEVAPWDVPHWSVERDGDLISSTLVSYRGWDGKPLIYDRRDSSKKPKTYQLIDAKDLQSNISLVPNPGELELLDALNLMERGDYSGAVRRVTTAIEVIVETVAGRAVAAASGKQIAEKFLKDTKMRFDSRLKEYEKLTCRKLSGPLHLVLRETRSLRHRIVHTGYRIAPSERGKAQKAVDTGRWIFNWFENDETRRQIRETRIAYRSLGRDSLASVFPSNITPDGVVLSPIGAPAGSRDPAGKHRKRSA